ncbi:MAG: OmpA family protein [Crocinitomicaceae bacterium]
MKIVGHTSDLGENAVNVIIGKGRAERAQQQLINKGINSQRTTINSQGKNSPQHANTSELNRSKNRRVQFVFTD